MSKEWRWQRRARKQKKKRDRMPVDGAGVKDVQRIRHKRWKKEQNKPT